MACRGGCLLAFFGIPCALVALILQMQGIQSTTMWYQKMIQLRGMNSLESWGRGSEVAHATNSSMFAMQGISRANTSETTSATASTLTTTRRTSLPTSVVPIWATPSTTAPELVTPATTSETASATGIVETPSVVSAVTGQTSVNTTVIGNQEMTSPLAAVLGTAITLQVSPAKNISKSSPALRPNIVWIMADDLGWGEVGLFPAKSPHGRLRTPHLDTFGREGLVFSHAYAGYSVCAPSRMVFFTGRHSGRFESMGVDGMGLRPTQNITVFPKVLQKAGYATGLFGKTSPLMQPLEQGFDVFLGQVHQGLCHNMYPRRIDQGSGILNFPLSGNFANKSRELCMAFPEMYNYTIDVFQDGAISWLREVSRAPAPFFLFLSYTIPHAGGYGDWPAAPQPVQPVPTDMGYQNLSWPEGERDHAAVVSYMDIKVGELMQELKSLGVDEQTICFFASDNGAHFEGGHFTGFFDSTGGLAGHKRGMFEGAVRSPSMVRWPGHIRPGTSQTPWAFWDVMPTVAELAGVEVEKGDGISLVPELLGQPWTMDPQRYFYFTWIGDGGRIYNMKDKKIQRNGPGYTVRRGRWKGMVPHCWDQDRVKPHPKDKMRLYDLEVDPKEKKDVASENPEIVRDLKRLVVSEKLTCRCSQCFWPFKKKLRKSMCKQGRVDLTYQTAV